MRRDLPAKQCKAAKNHCEPAAASLSKTTEGFLPTSVAEEEAAFMVRMRVRWM